MRIPPQGRELVGKLEICENVCKNHIFENPERYGLTKSEMGLDWSYVLDISKGYQAVAKIRRLILPESPKGFVYIHGDHGQAKTLMLKITVAMCAKRGIRAYYGKMSNLLDDIRLAYDSNNPNSELLRRVQRWKDIYTPSYQETAGRYNQGNQSALPLHLTRGTLGYLPPYELR